MECQIESFGDTQFASVMNNQRTTSYETKQHLQNQIFFYIPMRPLTGIIVSVCLNSNCHVDLIEVMEQVIWEWPEAKTIDL